MAHILPFKTEAELVAAFCEALFRSSHGRDWTVYHESGGFDLLLVQSKTGIQVGIEAKLAFNLKVLTQALPRYYWQETGPDYRGVLVPEKAVQGHLTQIAERLGIGVIALPSNQYRHMTIWLPDESWIDGSRDSGWHPWLPTHRCKVPQYVPDVTGGKPAPLQLTEWKIRAVKLMILLERRGFVTRADMKGLGLSAARWTQPGGYLVPDRGVYVAGERTPRFKAQHPTNWEQIAADFEKWAPSPPLMQMST